jgi:hypothetical protein
VPEELIVLNLRAAEAQRELEDAVYEGVRAVFQGPMKADAQARSPRGEKLKKGEKIHNADSIRARVRRTKKGPKATLYTESGHGGYLEIGTSRQAAEPYLYPAFQANASNLFGSVREQIRTVPSGKRQRGK